MEALVASMLNSVPGDYVAPLGIRNSIMASSSLLAHALIERTSNVRDARRSYDQLLFSLWRKTNPNNNKNNKKGADDDAFECLKASFANIPNVRVMRATRRLGALFHVHVRLWKRMRPLVIAQLVLERALGGTAFLLTRVDYDTGLPCRTVPLLQPSLFLSPDNVVGAMHDDADRAAAFPALCFEVGEPGTLAATWVHSHLDAVERTGDPRLFVRASYPKEAAARAACIPMSSV
jgi:hypothetical protein